MSLFEHLRELRYRLIVSCLAILIATIACYSFHTYLFNLLVTPWNRAIALLHKSRPDIQAQMVLSGTYAPFAVSLKISVLAGLVVSAPVWLYQIWAFIVPGLLAKEKKWTMIVVGAATPLFVAGIALGYYVLPKGIAVLLSFTPKGYNILNLQNTGDFLSFLTRLMLVFGLAFEIPLFILMLNIVGVLPAKYMSRYRSYIIFAVFVFAAVATPTPDAVTMLLLALPMVVLVIASEIIAHLLDRRKHERQASAELVVRGVEEDKALQALTEETTTNSSTSQPSESETAQLGEER